MSFLEKWLGIYLSHNVTHDLLCVSIIATQHTYLYIIICLQENRSIVNVKENINLKKIDDEFKYPKNKFYTLNEMTEK